MARMGDSPNKKDSRCSLLLNISPGEVKGLIAHANRSLAAGLNFMVESLISENRKTREDASGLYLARYEFGDKLISNTPSHSSGNFFIPPCIQEGRACRICGTLSAESGRDWPLFIILSKTAEESLIDVSSPTNYRSAPTRLLGPGQILGLSEVLNNIVDPDFPKRVFKAPVRSASAGIHSVYVTAPVGNKQLRDSLRALRLKKQNEPIDPALWNSDWRDWEFLRAVSEVAAIEEPRLSWNMEVIIIPVSRLRSILYSRGKIKSLAQGFLLELLEMAWKESRGTRSESLRQLIVSEAARRIAGNTNADLIVQRLLFILRGDAPGFRPAMFSDERLPMPAIWQTLIGNEQIRKKFFADHFPGIIEPFHLNRRTSIPKGTFFYYPLTSFEQLGHAGNPVDELDTIEAVHNLLRELQSQNPEMLGRIEWEFLASPAPLESKHNTAQSVTRRMRNVSVPFTSAELSEVVHKDFEPQLRDASNFGPVPSSILSKPPRKGLLRRFIRVSVH
jgi:hypothetical protein